MPTVITEFNGYYDNIPLAINSMSNATTSNLQIELLIIISF